MADLLIGLRELHSNVLQWIGVGDAMKNLHKQKMINGLNRNVIEIQKALLGICLGIQLLVNESSEKGQFLLFKLKKTDNGIERILHSKFNFIILGKNLNFHFIKLHYG